MDDLSADDIESLSEAMGESEDDTPAEEALDLPEESSPAEETEEEEASEETDDNSPNISHAHFMQLDESSEVEDLPMQSIERMHDIKVKVEVVLGKTKMQLSDILKLHSGSVIELNKLAGESVDILANGQLIARAEIVVIEDNFGIKIIEIAGSRQTFAGLQGN